MKKVMLYVNFDTRTIGYCENVLDWNVGEFTKKNGRDVMVYANFNLNEYGLKTFKHYFNKGLRKFDNFCDKVNYAVEELIRLTSTDDFGKRLARMETARSMRELDSLVALIESHSIGGMKL